MPYNCIEQTAISLERLKELSIKIYGVSTINKRPCWVISNAGVEKLEKIRYKVSRKTTDNADYQHCALYLPNDEVATVEADPRKIFSISFGAFDGSYDKKILTEQVTRILLPKVQRDIRIEVPHNRTRNPSTDKNTFVVWIWSSPIAGRIEHPGTCWGIPLATRDASGFGVWAAGNPVYSPEENHEFAAWDDGNLFIYFDAVHDNNENSKKNLERILSEFANLYSGGVGSIPRETVRKMYISACSGRAKKMFTDMKKQYETLSEDIDKLNTAVVDKSRAAVSTKLQLDLFGSNAEMMEHKLGSEFDRLYTLDKVVDVTFRAGQFAVITKKLYFLDPRNDKEHELGRMKFIFHSDTGMVYFHNLDRKVDAYEPGMNGPHLFPQGRACLGNMEQVIPKLVSSYEWYAATQVCINFCESVNLDDGAGPHCNKWPLSDRQKAKDREQIKSFDEWPDPNVNPFKKDEGKEPAAAVPAAAPGEKPKEAGEEEDDGKEVVYKALPDLTMPDWEDDRDLASREKFAYVGMRVVLAAHVPVHGGKIIENIPINARVPESNSDPDMPKYVDKEAIITSLPAQADISGCRMATVSIDGKPLEIAFQGKTVPLYWRVRNLRMLRGEVAKLVAEGKGVGDAAAGQSPSPEVSAPARPVEVVAAPAVAVAVPVPAEENDGRWAPVAGIDFERLDHDASRYERAAVGMRVVIARHGEDDDGEDNWARGMDQFVGHIATITRFEDDVDDRHDWLYCYLDIDGGEHTWRICNMRLCREDLRTVERGGPLPVTVQTGFGEREEVLGGEPPRARDVRVVYEEALDDVTRETRLRPGMQVVLAEHREIGGRTDWNPDMAQYVGAVAVIGDIIGNDGSGSRCALVEVNGNITPYIWRLRSMCPPVEGGDVIRETLGGAGVAVAARDAAPAR